MVNKPFVQESIDKPDKKKVKADLKRDIYKAYIIEHLGLKNRDEIAKELGISSDMVKSITAEISSEHGTVHPLLIATVGEEQYNQLKEQKDIARHNALVSEQELLKAQKANSEWKPSKGHEQPPISDEAITLLKHRVNSDMALFLAADGALTRFLNAIGHYRPEMKVDGNQPVIIQVNMIDMGEAIPAEEEPKKKEREVNERGK